MKTRQWHIKGPIPHDVLANFDRMMETVTWEALPPPALHDGDMPYETHRGGGTAPVAASRAGRGAPE
jgi:hypothetical protein